MERNYKMDNIRAFLIFTVVLGHLMEIFIGGRVESLYTIIYSFHIPAFVFITGYFASFKPRKIVFSLIYPYFFFQTAYHLFDTMIFNNNPGAPVQYTMPFWGLWYLLAIVMYHMMIPLIQTEKTSTKIAVMVAAIIVSLLAGMDTSIGYYLTLSRFFSFLPFFVIGYYIGHTTDWKKKLEALQPQKEKRMIAGCGLFLLLAELFILVDPRFHRVQFLGAGSYAAVAYSWKIKSVIFVVACVWIVLFLFLFPKKKLPVISMIGQNTFSIYILHGFLVRPLWRIPIFRFPNKINLLLAGMIAVGILLLLGNPYTAKGFKWGCTGHWVLEVKDRWGAAIFGWTKENLSKYSQLCKEIINQAKSRRGN